MSTIGPTWEVITDPVRIAEIEALTDAVYADKVPPQPGAAGSAGIPWGGADAMDYWKP
jgi:hypothetical protein